MATPKNQISLSELALELRINKSQLAWYVQKGLLIPIGVDGKKNIFDRAETMRRLGLIKRLQKEGKDLDQIKTVL